MMAGDQEQCPARGVAATTTGRFFGRPLAGFLPAGLRFSTLKARPVPFPAGASPRACAACGLVWVRVDPASLRQVLGEAGTDETRRRFEDGGAESRPAV